MSNERKDTFGGFIKDLRAQRRVSLRSFCLDNGIDAGNYSKMERDILPPPQDKEKLQHLAEALGLEKDSKDWKKFFDLAAVTNGKIPEYIMQNEELLNKLPIFFRTFEGQKIDDEKLEQLIELIKRS